MTEKKMKGTKERRYILVGQKNGIKRHAKWNSYSMAWSGVPCGTTMPLSSAEMQLIEKFHR